MTQIWHNWITQILFFSPLEQPEICVMFHLVSHVPVLEKLLSEFENLRFDYSKSKSVQSSATLKTRQDSTAKVNWGNDLETITVTLRLQFVNHLLTVLLLRVELLCCFGSVSRLKMFFLSQGQMIGGSTDDGITLGLLGLVFKKNDSICKNPVWVAL